MINYNFTKSVLTSGVALFLVGCGAAYSPNVRSVTFSGGKPYYTPRGAYYGLVTHNTNLIDNKHLKVNTTKTSPQIYQIIKGGMCRVGEVRWVEKKTQEKLLELAGKVNKTKSATDWDAYYTFRYQAFRSGKAGCSKTLNQQEYQYRLNQQNQSAANRRVASQNSALTTAALMPKTVNVNHSGSIDVYKY